MSPDPSEQQIPAVDVAPPAITILGGNPTPVELAAVTAVITGVLEELSEERARASTTGQSAWQRSQRQLRGTLSPGLGAWRSFDA